MKNVIEYLNKSFGRVWVDETIPCVYTSINGLFTLSQLELLVDMELTCIKKYRREKGKVYSVVDMNSCSIVMEEILISYAMLTIQVQFISGLNGKYFVAPRNLLVQNTLIFSLQHHRDENLGIFRTLEDAVYRISCDSEKV